MASKCLGIFQDFCIVWAAFHYLNKGTEIEMLCNDRGTRAQLPKTFILTSMKLNLTREKVKLIWNVYCGTKRSTEKIKTNTNNVRTNIKYFMTPHRIFLKYIFCASRKCNNFSLLSTNTGMVRSVTDIWERFFWEISILQTLMGASKK